MEDATVLAHCLLEYEKLVAHCNQMITDYYQLDRPPMLAKSAGLIPRSATITLNGEALYYSFHGIGCFCILRNRIIDFDYCYGTFEYQGFDVYKVWDFIESEPNIKKVLKSKPIFFNALLELRRKDIIFKNPENEIDTYDYILDQEKLKDLEPSAEKL